ncbi:MAG: glycoside hydrolase family 5 protein [Patescibacteria group bacterium]|nr:glycoside hydrolase family 5 protein [Patescibacteria group bacterium]
MIFGSLLVISLLSGQNAYALDNIGFVSASGTSLSFNGKTFTPKGVNLMDHDSLWYVDKITPTFAYLKEKDLRSLKASGFNSVRLSVKTDYFQDTNPPHNFNEAGFQWLDQIISLAKRNNIKLILDMHMPTGGVQQDYQINAANQQFWNDPWLKGRFVDVWREIARRYANEPVIWAYDLMNEPATTDFVAYEGLMKNTVSSIRSYDPNHLIMLQRGMFIKDDGSWDMKYPEINDSQIVRSIHFYQPTDFTLQSAPWFTTKKVSVTYPTPIAKATKDVWNASRIKNELTSLAQEASSSTMPVVLTEFGTLFPKRLTGQLQWVTDIASIAQNLGLGWHYWHYSGPTCSNAFALKSKYGICRPLTLKTLSRFAIVNY